MIDGPLYERSIRDLDVTVRAEPLAGPDGQRVSFRRRGQILLTVVEGSRREAEIALVEALDWIVSGAKEAAPPARFAVTVGLLTGGAPLRVRIIHDEDRAS